MKKNSVKKLVTLLTTALLVTSVSGCALPFGIGAPKVTPTPLPTPPMYQPRATHTPTPKPTNTPTPTNTATPTPTPCDHQFSLESTDEIMAQCPLCGRDYVATTGKTDEGAYCGEKKE